MRQCQKCNTENPDKAGFCKSCGHSLVESKRCVRLFPTAILIALVVLSVFCSLNGLRYKQLNAGLKSQLGSLQGQLTDARESSRVTEGELSQANADLRSSTSTVEAQKVEITKLKNEKVSLKRDLDATQAQLEETTGLYEAAQPYQERVLRGQYISLYYALLDDREDFAKPIILSHLGMTQPIHSVSDTDLWYRGKRVYDWLEDNYQYCGDKGLRVGNTFAEFQFFSPDELLASDNARCGDCDDFATLFAGLLYASGVPEDKVWVVCGYVPGGGHCWNQLVLSNATYRIDPVCSQKTEIISILGYSLGIQGAAYTFEQENVDCFSDYTAQMIMNPNGYHVLGG